MTEQFKQELTSEKSELEKQFDKAMREMSPEVSQILIKIAVFGLKNEFPGVIGARLNELLEGLQKLKIVEGKNNDWQLTDEFRTYWVNQLAE